MPSHTSFTAPPALARVSISIPTHRERGFMDEALASVRRNIRAEDEVPVVARGSPAYDVARF